MDASSMTHFVSLPVGLGNIGDDIELMDARSRYFGETLAYGTHALAARVSAQSKGNSP